jgi:hypothetical protein
MGESVNPLILLVPRAHADRARTTPRGKPHAEASEGTAAALPPVWAKRGGVKKCANRESLSGGTDEKVDGAATLAVPSIAAAG